MKTVLKIIAGIIGAFVIMGVLFAGCTAFVFNGVDDDNTEEVKNEGNTETTTIDENKDAPREYQNALASAEMYQETLSMSEEGLRDQLTSPDGDNYPEEAVKYALENIDIDYKEEALASAKVYQDTIPMSDDELFEQLTSDYGDKFTEEQAQYAIDNLDK